MASQWERMLAGQPYSGADAALVEARYRARRLQAQYRQTDPADVEKRYEILMAMLGKIGKAIEIEPPFYCDYGCNIYLGENFYANFNCVILDPAEVRIGENVFFGPGVHIYTAYHSVLPLERNTGYEMPPR